MDNDKQSLQIQKQSSVTTSPDISVGVVTPMVKIGRGKYIPLYGRDSQYVQVKDFWMDVYPVTNRNYLEFVVKNKRWRKSNSKKIFVDDNYSIHWKNDTTLGEQLNENSPVTNVSWYAAKAYCECQGKRLATVDEWEYVAMSDQTKSDARKVKAYNQYILDWYEKPKTF